MAPGIVSYSTASHGGIHLSDERVAEMPQALQDFVPFGGPQPGPGRWFEEDCDWSVVALAFPQFFTEDDVKQAHATLKGYRPEVYREFVGSKDQYAIHYASREFAREHGDPHLGVVEARSKEEAEALAAKDGDIAGKAVPGAGLWAVKIRQSEEEKAR
jgi:hypothetical protein